MTRYRVARKHVVLNLKCLCNLVEDLDCLWIIREYEMILYCICKQCSITSKIVWLQEGPCEFTPKLDTLLHHAMGVWPYQAKFCTGIWLYTWLQGHAKAMSGRCLRHTHEYNYIVVSGRRKLMKANPKGNVKLTRLWQATDNIVTTI